MVFQGTFGQLQDWKDAVCHFRSTLTKIVRANAVSPGDFVLARSHALCNQKRGYILPLHMCIQNVHIHICAALPRPSTSHFFQRGFGGIPRRKHPINLHIPHVGFIHQGQRNETGKHWVYPNPTNSE